MIIPTTENLFEHKCLFKDMKLSGFNPESLSYYCGVCGGKISLKKTQKADEYIKAKASLKLSRQLYLLCVEDEKAAAEKIQKAAKSAAEPVKKAEKTAAKKAKSTAGATKSKSKKKK